MIAMNLVTPKRAAKHKRLFNKPASLSESDIDVLLMSQCYKLFLIVAHANTERGLNALKNLK
jgi:hypothetical protein